MALRFATICFTLAGAFAQQEIGPLYSVSTIAGGTYVTSISGDGGSALSALLFSPSALALDRESNLYISEKGAGAIRKVAASGVITTVVGRNAPASNRNIQFGGNLGVVVDDAGALYIADVELNRVVKLATNGDTRIVAGTGAPGDGGDGGPATAAPLRAPYGLALDHQGNLFIGEAGGNRVRRVRPDGIISTIAGTGRAGFSGDGGPATDAELNYVLGLALDDAGNLWVADTGNLRIRRIAPTGEITTVAGNGLQGVDQDGISANEAQLRYPTGVTVGRDGTAYIADTIGSRIRRIAPDGTITTVAGTGTDGFQVGDGGSARSSQLYWPLGVLVDATGNLYISDSRNSVVRRVTGDGKIRIVAGTGSLAVGDGGPGADATFASPTGVAVDGSGNTYVADSAARRIRKISATGMVSTVAGRSEPGFTGDGGLATEAALNQPNAVAVDRVGNLYIADAGNHRVRQVDPTGVIRTIAGNGTRGFGGDAGPATAAQLSAPLGVAVDIAGNVYIADTGNHRIRRVVPGGAIATIAGAGEAGFGGDNGAATAALLSSPRAVAVDGAGNVFIADTGNYRVREITPQGVITTVAGTGMAGFSGDGGPAPEARVSFVSSVAVDTEGNLYIADSSNSRIRHVSPAGVIRTFIGFGFDNRDGGPGFLVGARFPSAVAVAPSGTLYFADGGQTPRIRKTTLFRSTGAAPQIVPLGVANSAGLTRGAVAAGEIVTLYGTDFGPATAVTASADASAKISTALAGTRVLFDGIPAPVLSTQAYQVQAVTPFAIAGRNSVQVEVEYLGRRSPAQMFPVSEAVPGIFSQKPFASEGPYAAALNEDGTVNSPSNPARVGSVMTLYATGIGAMFPVLADGKISGGEPAEPTLPVVVVLNCLAGDVLYAGPAPGFVAGTAQINFRVTSAPQCGPTDRGGGVRLDRFPIYLGVRPLPEFPPPFVRPIYQSSVAFIALRE